jgi:ribonuclease P protein component
MNKTISLNKNRDFLNVYKNGRFYCAKYLVIYVLKNDLQEQRLGITVSKKVGNSVKRNRLKRLVKENYRHFENLLKVSNDIVFVVRKSEFLPSFFDLKKEMKYLFKKLDLLL